jgi:hypothetical protein
LSSTVIPLVLSAMPRTLMNDRPIRPDSVERP